MFEPRPVILYTRLIKCGQVSGLILEFPIELFKNKFNLNKSTFASYTIHMLMACLSSKIFIIIVDISYTCCLRMIDLMQMHRLTRNIPELIHPETP